VRGPRPETLKDGHIERSGSDSRFKPVCSGCIRAAGLRHPQRGFRQPEEILRRGPRFHGRYHRRGVIEVYASPKATWTLVISQPNGVSCLITAGQDWEELPNPEMISGTQT